MTANRATLLALASRVEAATGADRELDALVAEAHWQSRWGRSKPKDIKAEPVTASLDAAMTLVPSGLILRNYQSSRFVPHSCEVALSWAHGGWLGNSDHSFALALTAACLRARAMLEQDNG